MTWETRQNGNTLHMTSTGHCVVALHTNATTPTTGADTQRWELASLGETEKERQEVWRTKFSGLEAKWTIKHCFKL